MSRANTAGNPGNASQLSSFEFTDQVLFESSKVQVQCGKILQEIRICLNSFKVKSNKIK